MYSVGSSCAARPETYIYVYIQRDAYLPSSKRKTGKRPGKHSTTKGCFNSLLSSVARSRKEEKVKPPVRNYLAEDAQAGVEKCDRNKRGK